MFFLLVYHFFVNAHLSVFNGSSCLRTVASGMHALVRRSDPPLPDPDSVRACAGMCFLWCCGRGVMEVMRRRGGNLLLLCTPNRAVALSLALRLGRGKVVIELPIAFTVNLSVDERPRLVWGINLKSQPVNFLKTIPSVSEFVPGSTLYSWGFCCR